MREFTRRTARKTAVPDQRSATVIDDAYDDHDWNVERKEKKKKRSENRRFSVTRLSGESIFIREGGFICGQVIKRQTAPRHWTNLNLPSSSRSFVRAYRFYRHHARDSPARRPVERQPWGIRRWENLFTWKWPLCTKRKDI